MKGFWAIERCMISFHLKTPLCNDQSLLLPQMGMFIYQTLKTIFFYSWGLARTVHLLKNESKIFHPISDEPNNTHEVKTFSSFLKLLNSFHRILMLIYMETTWKWHPNPRIMYISLLAEFGPISWQQEAFHFFPPCPASHHFFSWVFRHFFWLDFCYSPLVSIITKPCKRLSDFCNDLVLYCLCGTDEFGSCRLVLHVSSQLFILSFQISLNVITKWHQLFLSHFLFWRCFHCDHKHTQEEREDRESFRTEINETKQ